MATIEVETTSEAIVKEIISFNFISPQKNIAPHRIFLFDSEKENGKVMDQGDDTYYTRMYLTCQQEKIFINATNYGSPHHLHLTGRKTQFHLWWL